MPWSDPAIRRAYMRKRYHEHREQEHARARAYYQKNRDAVLVKSAQRARETATIERRKELRQMKMEYRQAWVSDYKRGHGCSVCGESHPACLDFHHREPQDKATHGKHSSVSSVMRKWKWERVLAEIALCDVVCANCHRKIHSEMGWEWTHEVGNPPVPIGPPTFELTPTEEGVKVRSIQEDA